MLLNELDLFLYIQTLWRIGFKSVLPVLFNFASDIGCARAFREGVNKINYQLYVFLDHWPHYDLVS